MTIEVRRMQNLIDQAKTLNPIRLAVVGAGQGLVLDGVQQAKSLGLVEPCLIGNAQEIADLAKQYGWIPAPRASRPSTATLRRRQPAPGSSARGASMRS